MSLGKLGVEKSEYASEESFVDSAYLVILAHAQINQQWPDLLLVLHQLVVSQFSEVRQYVVQHYWGRALQSSG